MTAPFGPARKVLVVSPHLDDAMLSVGGTVSLWTRAGASVTVLTVFGGIPKGPLTPFAEGQHRAQGLPLDPDAAFEIRIREDTDGVNAVGGLPVHGPTVEVIYRLRADGEPVCSTLDDIWAAPSEPGVLQSISAEVAELIAEVEPDLLVGPGAVGGNVDHVLTSTAVRNCGAAAGLRTVLWEDQPYAWNLGTADESFTRVELDTEAQHAKEAAVGCYVSQTTMLWPDGSWRTVLAAAPSEGFREIVGEGEAG